VSPGAEDRLADLLARREEDPGAGANDLGDLEPGLRRAVDTCASLERELATLSLTVQGHPERAGPWVLLRPLARGHSGTVYLAERDDGSRRAAIRFLTPHDGDALRETARAAIGWEHDAVIPVLEAEDDWIASAVSDGVTLAAVLADLARDPAADPRETTWPLLAALAPVAEALTEAHARGLVHGGVSPRRIDVSRSGKLRLRDFGFDPTRAWRPPTPDAPPLGSPHYLAPEQAGAPGEVGPATDVYSFAAVVRSVATGLPPYDARSLTDLLGRIRSDAPPSPAPLIAAVPEELASAVSACLVTAPSARPANLASLAVALAAGRD
jgi:serine/threonine-protein kinase